MPDQDETALLWALATGTAIKTMALFWLGNARRKEFVGTVSQLFVYPVKSCKPLKDVNSVTLTKHGFKTAGVVDRHWSVTKTDGTVYCSSRNGRLTLIQPEVKDDVIILNVPGHPPLKLPIDPAVQEKDISTVRIELTTLSAVDCGEEAAAWVCSVLKKEDLRLKFSAQLLVKRKSCHVPRAMSTLLQEKDEIVFQSVSPCMVMCEPSVESLNKRLEKPVTCMNFRPNLLVEGTIPFDEDNWSELYIGSSVHVKFVDHCQRCHVVTIDPESGARAKDAQPLTELKRFRNMPGAFGPHKPVMGIHTAMETGGVINRGDSVYVIRKLGY